MKNILIFIQQLIKKLTKKSKRGLLISLSALITMVMFLMITGIVEAADMPKETTIVFDQTNPWAIALGENKVAIQPGLAKVDMDKLNLDHNPEAIKAYIQQLGAEYDVDWKLVYAIGAYESGYFQSSLAQRNNNFFGRKANSSSWMSYDTAEEGIRNQFDYLKTRYLDKGMDTPAEMNRVYCEGDSWQYKVQFIMDSV